MKENKEDVIWTILFIIAVIFKYIYKHIVTIKNSAVDGIRNRRINKEKKTAKKKVEKDVTRKKRVGTFIDHNDPWSNLPT